MLRIYIYIYIFILTNDVDLIQPQPLIRRLESIAGGNTQNTARLVGAKEFQAGKLVEERITPQVKKRQ